MGLRPAESVKSNSGDQVTSSISDFGSAVGLRI